MSVFSNKISRFCTLVVLLFLCGFSSPVLASDAESDTTEFNASAVILHHVLDDHIWHFWDGHYGTLYLPVIVYSSDRGLEVFSSHNFYDEHHNVVEYNGYKLEHSHITLNGQSVLDLSITKNVAMLLITATILVLVFTSVARGAKKNKGKAPKGIQSFFEPIVVFVRDEIVKPNIGHHYEKYLPYLLTLFFFVLFANLLGLVPGSGNLSGNIAVTLTLAVFTFLITNFSGNKGYWSHIFWTPGVPMVLRPIIMLVEVIGIFTKPFSLTIRLFVAITAGHIVLLSLICLAFIFKSVYVGAAASLMVLFINLIELLVAAIQAYVFTLFTALYIGMATAEHEHH
jgi:F-type H+-transporting ATPase subunit a